jgi:hypothetical protein
VRKAVKLLKRRFVVSEDLVNRLIAVGCPFDEDVQKNLTLTRPKLVVRQQGGVAESQAKDLLALGGTGYIVGLSVGCDLPAITISHWELEPPWNDPQILWLTDPYESVPSREVYSLPGISHDEFSREIVINHRRHLKRGQLVEGLLLGCSLTSIPDRYRHGQLVEMKLVLVDHVERRYASVVSLWIDRSSRFDSKIKTPRRRLFGESATLVSDM